MATYLNCIVDEHGEGKIDDATAETLFSRYGDAYEEASKTQGPDQADRTAGKATQESAEKEAMEERRRALLQGRARQRILDGFEKFKLSRGYQLGEGGGGGRRGGGGGGVPPIALMPPGAGPFKGGAVSARALQLLISNRGGLSGAPFPSVEGRYKAVRGLFDAHMQAVIAKFETNTGLDTPNRAIMPNIVREAFGEHTGDQSARELAHAWNESAELARQMFNEAGGSIGKRADWGMPQMHDAAKVHAAGQDAWVESIIPMLDRAKMVDDFTGAPFGDSSIRQVLGDVWKSIVTHGMISRSPDDRLGIGVVAKQRQDERFIVFKDADAWSTYQGQFGRSDAFDGMMAHLDSMAHDIAQMQILGPNPDANFQWLKRLAEIEANHEMIAGAKGAVADASSRLNKAQAMWDGFTGLANVPENETLAKASGNVRNVLRAAQLGSAILTDMPSAPFFGSMARAMSGINLHGDVTQLVKLLADPSMREEVATAGFINEAATDGLISTTRDQLRLQTAGSKAAETTNALARKLPSATLRLSGLTPMFEARKRSFRLSFMRTLHNAKGLSLDGLRAGDGAQKALATELNARGITNEDWDAIRSSPSWEPREGVQFLRPVDIVKHASDDLGFRVGEMILNMEQMAVPVSGSLWTRSAMMRSIPPGSILGEGLRSFAMYKTFLINAQYLYAEEFAHRALAAAEGAGMDPASGKGSFVFGLGRFGGAASLIIPLTIAGAVTLQLKQIANGKDPLYMGTPKFWGAALLQGGSLGLLGDFFYSAHSRFGHQLAITGAGPVADFASDVWDMTGGEAADVYDRATNPAHADKPDKEAKRAVQFARNNTPILSSLLWSKAAYQRGVLDQVQKLVDPEADAAFERAKARMQRETGQEAWWPQGSLAPQRAPDLSAAFRNPHP